MTTEQIKKDIAEAFYVEAIEKAIVYAKHKGAYKSLQDDLQLLSGQLQNYRREKALSLKPDPSIEFEISRGLMTVVDRIERIADDGRGNRKIPKETSIGKIVQMNNARRFGFIKSRDFKNEIFFHYSSMENEQKPLYNRKVLFEIDKSSKGWYAPSVTLMEGKRKNRKRTPAEKRKQLRELEIQRIKDDLMSVFDKAVSFLLHIIKKFI